MTKTKRLSTAYLRTRLDQEGLPSSRTWLDQMMKAGKISLPKYKHANRYVITEETVEQVIEDLKKKGSYNYETEKSL